MMRTRQESEKDKRARLIERWSTRELVEDVRVEGKIAAYYLREPGRGRMGSCYLVFTCEGIVIMGDWSPGATGVISTRGYSEGWFAGKLSASYLAEKFLRRSWQPAQAWDYVGHRILQARRDGYLTRDRAREVWDDLHDIEPAECTPDKARTVFDDADLSDFDGGWDYDPHDLNLLVAIQRRFAACKAAMVEQPV